MTNAIGYVWTAGAAGLLKKLKVPGKEFTMLRGTTLSDGEGGRSPKFGKAAFVTRTGINLILMASDKPKAQEFRQWLAGDVVNAIVDTGGYLLNETARDTAKADTRTSVPLPTKIAGNYAELIAEKMALKVKTMSSDETPSAGRQNLL